jgi:hypothetical protein
LYIEGSGVWLDSISIDDPYLGPLVSIYEFHSLAQDKNKALIRDGTGRGEEKEADGDVKKRE